MKVILYMATTANGFIAKKNDDTPWSKEEYASYFNFVRKRGNIVVGKRTYEIMKATNLLKEFREVTVVVLSHHAGKKSEGRRIFVSSAAKAVNVLKNRGFKEIVVAGGGKINASFLRSGLIDEIYLDVEPMIFGDGIKLFSETARELKLRLLGTKKLSKDSIQLHYKVIK